MEVIPLRPTTIQALTGLMRSASHAGEAGRVFSAEVLQVLDGGSVVLGVGRERIAATSQAALQVGQRLWLRVRGEGSATALELVPAPPEEDAAPTPSSALPAGRGVVAGHPFALLAQGNGLTERLSQLARALVARGGGLPAANAAGPEGFAFTPGEGAERLRERVQGSGLLREARAFAAAIDALPPKALAEGARDVLRASTQPLPEAERAPALERLSASLAQGLDASAADETPAGPANAPAADARLARLLPRALEQALAALPAADRAAILDAFLPARLSPRLSLAIFEALLAARPDLVARLQSIESAQLAALKPRSGPSAQTDLKQWLIELLSALDVGGETPGSAELRDAARSAVESLETEQRLALARSGAGDGAHYLFALRDGAGLSHARLVHRRVDDEGGDANARAGASRGGDRAVLGLEFSSTGPVRADFWRDDAKLRVRLAVGDPAVAARFQDRMDELARALEALGGGRELHLSVECAPRESLRVPDVESDLRLAGGLDGGPLRGAVDLRA